MCESHPVDLDLFKLFLCKENLKKSDYKDFSLYLFEYVKNPVYIIYKNGMVWEFTNLLYPTEKLSVIDSCEKAAANPAKARLKTAPHDDNADFGEVRKDNIKKTLISKRFIEILNIVPHIINKTTTIYHFHYIIKESPHHKEHEEYSRLFEGEEVPDKSPVYMDIIKLECKIHPYGYEIFRIINERELLYSLQNEEKDAIKEPAKFMQILRRFLIYSLDRGYYGIPDELSADILGDMLYDTVYGFDFSKMYDKNFRNKLFKLPKHDSPSDLRLSAAKVIELINKYPSAQLLLAYSVNTISRFYLDNAGYISDVSLERKCKFALHLYTSNKDPKSGSPNTIANLFLNFFSVSFRNYKNILKDGFSVCLNKKGASEKFPFCFCLPVPVIVYSDSEKLSGCKKKAQDIINKTIEKDYDYAPVFVSRDAVVLKNCLSYDISACSELANRDALEEYKPHLNFVYREYIKYLAQKCLNNDYDDAIDCMNEINYYAIKDEYIYMYQVMGYNLTMFTDFLDMLDCDSEFFNELRLASEPDKNADEQPYSEVLKHFFEQYLSSVFVNKTISPEYDHFEGNEPDGTECYYLEGSKYFHDFIKRYPVCVTHREFNSMLKDSNMIIYRNNASLTLSRASKNIHSTEKRREKRNYLVVKKCMIELFND